VRNAASRKARTGFADCLLICVKSILQRPSLGLPAGGDGGLPSFPWVFSHDSGAFHEVHVMQMGCGYDGNPVPISAKLCINDDKPGSEAALLISGHQPDFACNDVVEIGYDTYNIFNIFCFSLERLLSFL
jgi:hypothetical protein